MNYGTVVLITGMEKVSVYCVLLQNVCTLFQMCYFSKIF